MKRLEAQTKNLVDKNIKRIGELFPNVMTERKIEGGGTENAIDFDALKQELSNEIVEGQEIGRAHV